MKIIIIRRKTTTSIHINDENDGNDETKKMINDLNRHALGQNDTTKKNSTQTDRNRYPAMK